MKPNNKILATAIGKEINKEAIGNTNKTKLESKLDNLLDKTQSMTDTIIEICEMLESMGYTKGVFEEMHADLDKYFEIILDIKESLGNIPNKTQKEWDLSKGFGK